MFKPPVIQQTIRAPRYAPTCVYRDGRYDFEHNDCTVRAVTWATNGLYENWHAFLKAMGRKDRKGFCFPEFERRSERFGFAFIIPDIFAQGMSLGQALQIFRNGRYICHQRGHVFPLIDGLVYDYRPPGLKTVLKHIWRVVPIDKAAN